MEIRILLDAVKSKLAPKRAMSVTEAEEENKKLDLAAGSEYVRNKRTGSMPPIKWAKAGETEAKDEYLTDRAMRNKASKNLSEKMKDKEAGL